MRDLAAQALLDEDELCAGAVDAGQRLHCAKLIYDSKVMYELAVGVYGTAVLHLFTGYLYGPLHAEAEAYVLCRDDFHCISSSRALSPSKAAVSRFVNSSDISLRLRFSRPSLLTGSPTIIRNRMES